LLHHRLIDELVREDVLTRRVVNDDRRVADHGGQIVVVHGVHPLPTTDADAAELLLPLTADDAVDVFAALEGSLRLLGALELCLVHTPLASSWRTPLSTRLSCLRLSRCAP